MYTHTPCGIKEWTTYILANLIKKIYTSWFCYGYVCMIEGKYIQVDFC